MTHDGDTGGLPGDLAGDDLLDILYDMIVACLSAESKFCTPQKDGQPRSCCRRLLPLTTISPCTLATGCAVLV